MAIIATEMLMATAVMVTIVHVMPGTKHQWKVACQTVKATLVHDAQHVLLEAVTLVLMVWP